MVMTMWVTALVVASCCAGSWGFIFGDNNQIAQCTLEGQKVGANFTCFDNTCPAASSQENFDCPSNRVCCRVDTLCVGVNCNNGSCVAGVGTCQCYDGYNGTNCEVDVCEAGNNGCSANSTCNRIPSPELYNCTCDVGFSGTLCDVDVCDAANNNCSANSTCNRVDTPDMYTCTCDDGFSGPLCDVDACVPSPCDNGGTCNRLAGGTYNCSCVDYWFGDNCTEDICQSNPCENGGTCTPLTTTTFDCNCPLNFTGANCSTVVCQGDNSECNGNGTCVPDATGNFTCNCFDGYSGDACEIAEPLCGVEQAGVTSRLKNAADDVQYSNPWIVNVAINNIVYCTGVLVDHRWVLTDLFCAAHCNSDHGCNVTLGDWDMTDDSEPYQQAIPVTNVVFHDLAVENTTQGFYALTSLEPYLANNIALLQLASPITKGPGVNTACPPQGFSTIGCDSSIECKLAAFGGNSDTDAFPRPNKRQVVSVKSIADEVCLYRRNLATMPANSHCALILQQNAGVCFADFGGGLVCRDPATNRFTLEGIAAFLPTETNLCSEQVIIVSDVGSLWSWVTTNLV